MSDQHKYDVFLSYSSKDRPWVAEFAEALRQSGVSAWFDKADLLPGEPWKERLQSALRDSNTLVVILSPNSVESPWTFFELGAAVADHKRIIPVITDDIDLLRIPSLLRQYQFLRGDSPTEAGKRIAEVLSAQSAA